MKKIGFGFLIFAAISSSHAATLIEDLAECNSNFFKNSLQNSKLSNTINDFYKTPINENGYKQSITLSDSGIELNYFSVTYSDFDKFGENIPGLPSGQYYFWGFESKQPIKQIANTLSTKINLIKVSNNFYIYNPQYRNSTKEAWQKNESAVNGIPAEKSSAEKLFILEAKEDGGTTILCSIQGRIIEEDLRNVGLIK